MAPFFRSLCFIGFFVAFSTTVATHARATEPLVVFAASSLTEVVSALGKSFETRHDQKVLTSFASTSVLARQIKDGAPAHVFIAANEAWMDDVISADMIKPESRTDIAGNSLVLVTPTHDVQKSEKSGEVISKQFDLTTLAPDLPFAIGNPKHVPVGIYARQALQSLELWEAYRKRMVPMPNARSVIATVVRGEVAAAVIYGSDLKSVDTVRSLGRIPATSHDPIRYSAGLVTEQQHRMARKFLGFLVSPEAKIMFKNFGFLPPPD